MPCRDGARAQEATSNSGTSLRSGGAAHLFVLGLSVEAYEGLYVSLLSLSGVGPRNRVFVWASAPSARFSKQEWASLYLCGAHLSCPNALSLVEKQGVEKLLVGIGRLLSKYLIGLLSLPSLLDQLFPNA